MTFSVAKDVVLFLLAIYGAALSTWNLVEASRNNRRAVRVTAGTKIPVIDGRAGDAWAHIEATNVGQRPVTRTMIALEVAGGGQRLFNMQRNGRFPGLVDTDLPITLSDGQTARLHFAYVDIGQALMTHGIGVNCQVIPVCEDSAGESHRGEPWQVDPQAFARM
jgi:hypothetical protein